MNPLSNDWIKIHVYPLILFFHLYKHYRNKQKQKQIMINL